MDRVHARDDDRARRRGVEIKRVGLVRVHIAPPRRLKARRELEAYEVEKIGSNDLEGDVCQTAHGRGLPQEPVVAIPRFYDVDGRLSFQDFQ